jgi:copper chaperone CopZ
VDILEKKTMITRTLTLEGMSCGHCVARVNKALSALPGVTVEDVKVGSARIRFEPDRTSMERIASTLDDAGYPVTGEDRAS